MPWLLLLIPLAVFGLAEISKPAPVAPPADATRKITIGFGPAASIKFTATRAQWVVALAQCPAVASSISPAQLKAMTDQQVAALALGLANTCWPGADSGQGGISLGDVAAAIAIYELL